MDMAAKRNTLFSPEQRQEIKKRLLSCLEVLRGKHIVDTYDDVANVMGVKPVTVRSAFAVSNSYLSKRFVERFLESFPDICSRTWLYTGEGQMTEGVEGEPPSSSARWERVQLIMDREGLNHITMSDAIGLKNYTTLYRVVRQHKKPQDGTLHKILKSFPQYREEWLMNGRGAPTEEEMGEQPYIDALNNRHHCSALPYRFEQVMTFPIASEPAVAGALTGYGDETSDHVSSIIVPVERNYKGEYQVFSVHGASMDDGSIMSLADGDLVLARKVDQKYWQDGLHTRKWLYFIFVTRNDGILIKKVIGQDNEQGLFHLHSLNPDYADITLDMREVVEIYNVIQVVQRRLTC